MQKRKEKYTKFCLNLQMGMEETWKESKRHGAFVDGSEKGGFKHEMVDLLLFGECDCMLRA